MDAEKRTISHSVIWCSADLSLLEYLGIKYILPGTTIMNMRRLNMVEIYLAKGKTPKASLTMADIFSFHSELAQTALYPAAASTLTDHTPDPLRGDSKTYINYLDEFLLGRGEINILAHF